MSWPPASPDEEIVCEKLHCYHLKAGICARRWWKRLLRSHSVPRHPTCGPCCDKGSEVVVALGVGPRRGRRLAKVEVEALEAARSRLGR